MSADNGVFIVQFPDGYRVTEGTAIDNIDYFPEGSKERKNVLKEYFGESPVFSTKEEALSYGHVLEDEIMNSECPILEYGVCYLGEYESFEESEEEDE